MEEKNMDMGHSLRIGFGIVLLALLFVGGANAATINVNTTGWWIDPAQFNASSTPIQAAINYASEGDTIYTVVVGMYTETLTINKGITLNGARAGTDARTRSGTESIISSSDPAGAVKIGASGSTVTIDGFEIRGSPSPGGGGTIFVNGLTDNVIVKNNIIGTSTSDAIFLYDAITGTVENNFVKGAALSGITGGKSESLPKLAAQLTIRNNRIEQSTYGISGYLNNTLISNNAVSNFSTGLGAGIGGQFYNTVIEHNTIFGYSTGAGVAFQNTFPSREDSKNVTVKSNVITNNAIGVYVNQGITGKNIQVTDRNFFSGDTVNIIFGPSGLDNLDATKNWWGTAVLYTIQSKFSTHVGTSVIFDPYYVDPAMTILSGSTPTDVYIDPAYADGDAEGHYYSYDAFNTIKEGIDAVTVGGNVHVSAGTYTVQLDIGKALTLSGAGVGSTIIRSPSLLDTKFTTSGPNKPIVYVNKTNGVNIRQLTVDGAGLANSNYRMDGIAYDNSSGTVDHVTFTGIRENPLSGTQQGVGLFANNVDGITRTLNVNNNTINDFQKNGMALSGNGLTVNVRDNTVTGAGPTTLIAQNGIQVSYGAAGTIGPNNVVSGISYTPGSWAASGLLVSNGNVDVLQNIVNNAQVGIYFIEGNGQVKGNTITGSSAGTGQTNYWGIIVDDPPLAKPSPLDEPISSASPKMSIAAISTMTVNVSGNTLSGGGEAGSVGLEADAGYLGVMNVAFNANDNRISGWGYGVEIYQGTAGTIFDSIAVNHNNISGNTINMDANVLADGTRNYWGTAVRPTIVPTITGSVTFDPYYVDPAMTILSNVAPMNVYINPAYIDGSAGGHFFGYDAFNTIQEGVNVVAPGGTVHVDSGMYSDPVNIENKNGITISGQDKTTTILKPTSTLDWNITTYGSSRKVVFRIVKSTGVVLQNMTMDFDLIKGNDVYGILGWNTTGTVSNNIIKNMSVSDALGGYYEIGSYFRAPDYTDLSRAGVTVSGNTFIDAGRVALLTHGYVNANIVGNTFYKTTPDFGYAMEVGSESTGTIRNNIIYGYNTPASDGSESAGIYIENAFTGSSPHMIKNVIIDNNEVYGSELGMWIGNGYDGYAGDVDINVSLINNNFHNNWQDGVHIWDEDKEFGSSVTINGGGNTLTNNGYTGYNITTMGDGNITFSLTGDKITGSNTGFYLNDTAGSASTSTYNIAIHQSNISGNTNYGINNTISTFYVNATSNWWGSATGPGPVGPGTGDNVSTYVLYDPWITIQTTYYLPFLYQRADNLYDAGVQIQNDGTSTANVEITFYNLDGTTAGTGVFDVQPHAMLTKHAFDIVTGQSIFVGAAIVKSNMQVQVQGYIKTVNEGVYSIAPSFTTPTENSYIPFLYQRADNLYDAGVMAFNPGPGTASVTIKMYNLDGTLAGTGGPYSVGPKQEVSKYAFDIVTGKSIFVGPVEVISTGSPVVAQGFIRTKASMIYSIAPSVSTSVSQAYLPFLYQRADNLYDAGVMAYNPGPGTASVTINMYNLDGTLAGTGGPYTVGPKQEVSKYAFDIVTGKSIFVGPAEVISTGQPIVAQGFIRTKASMVYSIAPQVRKPGAAGKAHVPFLYQLVNASHDAGIMAMNPNTASANVDITMYYPDGTKAGNVSTTLAPNAELSKYAFDIAPNLVDFNGSAIVTSDQPIVSQGFIRKKSSMIYSIAPPVER